MMLGDAWPSPARLLYGRRRLAGWRTLRSKPATQHRYSLLVSAVRLLQQPTFRDRDFAVLWRARLNFALPNELRRIPVPPYSRSGKQRVLFLQRALQLEKYVQFVQDDLRFMHESLSQN